MVRRRFRRALRLGTSTGALTLGLLAVAEDGGVRFAAVAQAQPPVESPPPTPAAARSASFSAALKQGDGAYLRKAYQEAEQQYRAALKEQPENPVVHARVAEALRAQGKFDEAVEVLGQALQLSSTLTLRGKLLFMQADIRERQGKLNQAKERWNNYRRLVDPNAGTEADEQPVEEQGERTIDLDAPMETPVPAKPVEPAPEIKGETLYPASASERLRQIAAAMKREKEYGPVRERIRSNEGKPEQKKTEAEE